MAGNQKKPPVEAALKVANYHRSQLWKAHIDKWKHCTKCPLHEHRNKVVLARGEAPAEVIFIGEAPGPREDDVGEPFIGPAGNILNALISAVEENSDCRVSFAISNTVACFPHIRDELGEVKIRPPVPEEVAACAPRLLEFLQLAIVHPRSSYYAARKRDYDLVPVIVPLGKVALRTIKNIWKHRKAIEGWDQKLEELMRGCLYLPIEHPAYMARNGGKKSVPYQRAILTLTPLWEWNDKKTFPSDVYRANLQSIERLK